LPNSWRVLALVLAWAWQIRSVQIIQCHLLSAHCWVAWLVVLAPMQLRREYREPHWLAVLFGSPKVRLPHSLKRVQWNVRVIVWATLYPIQRQLAQPSTLLTRLVLLLLSRPGIVASWVLSRL